MDTKENQKLNTFTSTIYTTSTTNHLKEGMFSYQDPDESDSDSDDEKQEVEEEVEDDETFEEMTHVNFAIEQEQNTVVEVVTIYATQNGRKKNTYIIGLKNSQEEQLVFLRNMKRKYGCNGSMKNVTYEGVDVPALHLQGDQIKKAKAFLAEQNITNVEVKDLIV